MNINALRTKFSVQHDTAFTATLHWSANTDEDVTVTGAQRGIYTQTDVINYGPMGDNPLRSVILLPCLECVDSDGESIAVGPDCTIEDTGTGEQFIVNAADKTLKGTWWRCIVSLVGR